MAVAGNTPTAHFLTKIGKMQLAGYRLCRIAREARGESTVGLAAKTHGHINSVSYEGMTTTVTAAHYSTWRHLYDSTHAAQHWQPKSRLEYVTLDEESNMSTLRRRDSEESLRICSKKDLAEKAQDIEVTIAVKKSQGTRFYFDLVAFCVNHCWGRRPHGVAINKALQIVYITEFERSTDRD